MKCFHIFLALSLSLPAFSQTYAERLGFPKNSRVLILHIDDAGMSADSNDGVIQTVERSPVRSYSIMMPTPWVPQIAAFTKSHPDTDPGVHLTLTSEWKNYRWHPLSGTASPSLIDPQGALWSSVSQVAKNATLADINREIHAQFDRAIQLGITPTHIDSHMGTLFSRPDFLELYIQLGIEKKTPIMIPAGHNTDIAKDSPELDMAGLRKIGQRLWDAGLPVLDDLHNTSYSWKFPRNDKGVSMSDLELQSWRTGHYIETIRALKPGLTMVIMHNTASTAAFTQVSDSGPLRRADMLAMIDPKFQAFLRNEGFILTTWREVMERRKKAH